MAFADRLRAHRAESGLSQYELADRTGLARTQIADYEQGRHEPSLEALGKLSDAFGCSADSLLGRQPQDAPKGKRRGKAGTLDEVLADADKRKATFVEVEGKPYRKRKEGWEPV